MKSVTIISFSYIHRDARVLRQIRYLAPHYCLHVIGFGPPHPMWQSMPSVRYTPITKPQWNGDAEILHTHPFRQIVKKVRVFQWLLHEKALKAVLLTRLLQHPVLNKAVGLIPSMYEWCYWAERAYTAALHAAIFQHSDIIYANDWTALPVGAEAAARLGARLIFDAHEYAPLEFEESKEWRRTYQGMIRHLLKRYQMAIDASITVAPAIAERYAREYTFKPIVVLNIPEYREAPQRVHDAGTIRLIHHGGAMRARKLDRMIETLARCDRRYSLTFMLVGADAAYQTELQQLAEKVAPGRVQFRAAVLPEEIVTTIAEYDMGFYLLEPTNYNNSVALPNKLFDFIAARLPVCIGPSPGMVELVEKHGIGLVCPSFEPDRVAEKMNQITAEELTRYRAAVQETAAIYTAEKEMQKLVALVGELGGERISV